GAAGEILVDVGGEDRLGAEIGALFGDAGGDTRSVIGLDVAVDLPAARNDGAKRRIGRARVRRSCKGRDAKVGTFLDRNSGAQLEHAQPLRERGRYRSVAIEQETVCRAR